jgi:pSer/pThr/pTyr-binding forkhead associated (FHA) protein
MRAQLIVVQGKLEGKKIPLIGPVFRIGRGETCHLRPNSAQVSREHAEFTISADGVAVRDLGSRNGTLVNGKALTKSQVLKDRDVVQVGPLAFAVSLVGSSEGVVPSTTEEELALGVAPHLPSDIASLIPLEATGIHGGDTIMIAAFKESPGPRGTDVSDDENDEGYERLPVDEGPTEEMSTHFLEQTPAAKPSSKRSGDAAADILRKLMARRKATN